MAEQQGTDVLHLKLPGMEMVILSTSEAISDLLDKRSAIYSDKPSSTMVELMEVAESAMAVMPYGPRWRVHRKLFHDFINISTVKDHDVNQIKVVSNFLINLHKRPEAFSEHIELLTGSFALSIAYGIQADTPDNEFLRAYKDMLEGVTEATVPGAFLVDILPFLKHLPSWFPGVKFHAHANKVREAIYTSKTRPMEHVIARLQSGDDIEASMASVCLGNLEVLNKNGVDMEVISNTLGVVHNGMSDTTNATLNSFFLAMARNTGVMRTAQHQLDSVLGGERLPDHSDIDSLPYIVAIVKETFRWAPPVPIGATHRLMEDDVYRGMFIPGGATIIENIWAICYDEVVYPEPHTYNPARFLDKDGRLDPSVKAPEARVFGSGRRICPGRHLGIRILCFTIARILAAFDILPPVDGDGRPRIPEARYHKSMIRHTMPFECIVKPRSEKALMLIRDAVA